MALGAVADAGVWRVMANGRYAAWRRCPGRGRCWDFWSAGGGSRLGMMLLARLNPQATGVTSDDGFTMGQLSPQSVNLLVVTTLIGVFGAGVYFLLRGADDRAAVVPDPLDLAGPGGGGRQPVVHADGVDFTLDPVWLAIAMFVLIPGSTRPC